MLSLSVILIIFSLPMNSLAATLPYFGTTSETNYLWADRTNGDDQFTQVDYVSDGSNTIEWYRLEGTTATYISSSSVSGTGSITPPGNAAALKLRSNGGEIYLTHATSTNPNNREIYFETGGGGSGDDGGSGGDSGGVPGSSGDCGCVFRTPGWEEYIGKIDEIIGAIPPPPNWDAIAQTFRDTIVPKIISDTEDMLGRAPSPPSAPNRPGVNDGGLDKPTGNVAPGLDDSGFSDTDIKDGAEEIEERDDPTGGWDILNPVDSLPSQDEFKENAPEEGEAEIPEVPPVDAEIPGAPEEQENTAPTPPEEDNPAPGEPVEPDNPAPGGPAEQENQAPGAPEEQENTAPVPGDTADPAPTPEDEIGTAPTPSPGTGGYPFPGQDSSTAPIPGADNSTAPIPGQDNSTAPVPGS